MLFRSKVVHWLPKSELPEAGLPWIMNGDIIAITTKMPGLDIAHVGIAEYKEGKLHLLHASSTLGKVVVSDEPLNHMLNNNKSWTGIRVVRMSHSKRVKHFLLASCLFPTLLGAQEMASAYFLELTPDAQSAGMAGTGLATTDNGSTAIFHNA